MKTIRFKSGAYIGDPLNAVRIFNECEVDELIFLDIQATALGRSPDFELLRQIASECFMPLTYGGGVKSVEEAAELFSIGIEKVAINSSALSDPGLISRLSQRFGAQAIVVSIDVRRHMFGRYRVCGERGLQDSRWSPEDWARQAAHYGAGEILLTSVNNEGTWSGYDLALVGQVSQAVDIPVVANGGAGSLQHIREVIDAGASAAAAGSLFVFQKQDLGVLVNFPTPQEIADVLS